MEELSLKKILFDLQLGVETKIEKEFKSTNDIINFFQEIFENLDNFDLENITNILSEIEFSKYNVNPIYLNFYKKENKLYINISRLSTAKYLWLEYYFKNLNKIVIHG